jgi:hypothetical protein
MELRIFGALEVEEDGRVVRIAGAKQRTLLALLLLHADDPVPRDRLIGELWGVKQPQTAATALQVHVSQLRKALGRDLIVTRARGYLIRVADGELDLECFEQDGRTRPHRGPGRGRRTLAGGARPSWRGVPFAEIDALRLRAPRAPASGSSGCVLPEQAPLRRAARAHRLELLARGEAGCVRVLPKKRR